MRKAQRMGSQSKSRSTKIPLCLRNLQRRAHVVGNKLVTEEPCAHWRKQKPKFKEEASQNSEGASIKHGSSLTALSHTGRNINDQSHIERNTTTHGKLSRMCHSDNPVTGRNEARMGEVIGTFPTAGETEIDFLFFPG